MQRNFKQQLGKVSQDWPARSTYSGAEQTQGYGVGETVCKTLSRLA